MYCIFFRIGITVTESLRDSINETIKSVKDENLKHWLAKVSTVSCGHVVEVPKGLINTLNLIALQGSKGKL